VTLAPAARLDIEGVNQLNFMTCFIRQQGNRVCRRGESTGEESRQKSESTGSGGGLLGRKSAEEESLQHQEMRVYKRGESTGEDSLQDRSLYRRGESAGERVYRRVE
jgi:hypothetical protein